MRDGLLGSGLVFLGILGSLDLNLHLRFRSLILLGRKVLPLRTSGLLELGENHPASAGRKEGNARTKDGVPKFVRITM